jgi:hypothetical protein
MGSAISLRGNNAFAYISLQMKMIGRTKAKTSVSLFFFFAETFYSSEDAGSSSFSSSGSFISSSKFNLLLVLVA